MNAKGLTELAKLVKALNFSDGVLGIYPGVLEEDMPELHVTGDKFRSLYGNIEPAEKKNNVGDTECYIIDNGVYVHYLKEFDHKGE